MLDYLLQLKFSSMIWIFILPICLMAIDFVTGYYRAWKDKDVKSSKMRDGLGKKIAELCYIVIGVLFGFAFNLMVVAYFISIYISYMELVSINENCSKLGAKINPEAEKEIAEKILNEKIDTDLKREIDEEIAKKLEEKNKKTL